jgi:orotidine-5'-phosphate decarboxylase
LHFADRLIERARRLETPVCVGIDPRFGMLPPRLRRRAREVEERPDRAAAWAYTELARAVIDAVAHYACAVKVQAAFFEALGPPGFEAFARALRLARDHGLAAIADAKRGDIGPTSRAYAQGFFGGQEVDADVLAGLGADAVTVNPYFGTDGIEPFLEASDAGGGGVFVLVRTSNPSAAELQDLEVSGGEGAPGPLYRRVAALIGRWAGGREGECGYSSVGAVAGATSPGALEEIRALLPRSILLVPGYGAQGASAEEVACAFDARGEGAVVSASRSITFADRSAETLEELAAAAARAAREMRDAVREALA